MATISTHNGSTLSQGHNRREKKITDKEKHIKKDGQHETWADIDIKKAYSILFDQAIAEYNEKQTRKDRKIKDYYEKIEQDKKKHTCYEMIVGVYGSDSTPTQKKEILKEFAKGWKARNSHLVMVGCYWHNDEEGEQHIHIDYIPVYRSNKGLKVQNGLNKALEQQGIPQGESIHETRQIIWEKRENAYLELLCEERGLEVKRSKETRQHESTRAYKLRQSEQEKKELKEKCSELENATIQMQKKYNETIEQCKQMVAENEELKTKNKELKKELDWERRFDQFTDINHEWADDWDIVK